MSQRGPEENGTGLTEAVKQAVLFETGCSEKTCPRWHGSGDLKKCGIESQDEGTASEGGLSGGSFPPGPLLAKLAPNCITNTLAIIFGIFYIIQSPTNIFFQNSSLQIFFSKFTICLLPLYKGRFLSSEFKNYVESYTSFFFFNL